MNKLKILLAFAVGFILTCALVHTAVRVRAQVDNQAQMFGASIHVCADKDGVLRMIDLNATCPDGQRSLILTISTADADSEKPRDRTPPDTSLDKAKLEDLNRRLIKIEELGCDALRKHRVVAPFQVVDRNGKTMFYVGDGLAELFNSSGETASRMDAANEGGRFFATSSSGLKIVLGAYGQRFGFGMFEGSDQRIELGKRPAGNYALGFTKGDKAIAAIGQGRDYSGGLAFVADGSGVVKAQLDTSKSGTGQASVTSNGSNVLARLTEGSQRGGLLLICNSSSCDPPMVAAGTNENGVGIVATGPRFYAQGPTGAPGSFLIGKRQ